MTREVDLFDVMDRDMAVALMNLCAVRMCTSGETPVGNMVRDVQKHLMQYVKCSEEDIARACKKFDGFVERA